jgi:hypothetical protein
VDAGLHLPRLGAASPSRGTAAGPADNADSEPCEPGVDVGKLGNDQFMRIESRTDGVFFVAQPGGHPPVDFRMATNSGSEIVFLNPGHADHLKRIIYRRSGVNELTARIEGEDGGKPFAVDYVYRAATTAGCP